MKNQQLGRTFPSLVLPNLYFIKSKSINELNMEEQKKEKFWDKIKSNFLFQLIAIILFAFFIGLIIRYIISYIVLIGFVS